MTVPTSKIFSITKNSNIGQVCTLACMLPIERVVKIVTLKNFDGVLVACPLLRRSLRVAIAVYTSTDASSSWFGVWHIYNEPELCRWANQVIGLHYHHVKGTDYIFTGWMEFNKVKCG